MVNTVVRSRLSSAAFAVAVAIGAVTLLSSGVALGDSNHEPTVDNTTLDATAVDIETGPGQLIEGQSDAHAGVDLTVRFVLFPGETAFERIEKATVDETGTFRTTTNLTVVPEGTPVRVLVEFDETELVNESTTVGECQTACEPPATTGPQAETALSYVGDSIELEAGPGRAVRGETELSPGTEMSVRLLSMGETPSLLTSQTTVATDGTFRTVFDLSGTDDLDYAGADFDVTVLTEGEPADKTTLRAVECTTDCELPRDEQVDPEFGKGIETTGTVGEAFLLPVELNDRDTAYLNVTSVTSGERDSFAVTARVHDGTGDDRVVVVFDTGDEGPTLSAAHHGDEVVVENRSGTVTDMIYDVALFTVPPESADMPIAPHDVESVEVEPAETTPSPTDPTAPTDSNGGIVPLVLFVIAGLVGTAGVAVLTGTIELSDSSHG